VLINKPNELRFLIMKKLDKIDFNLISILQTNARITIKEISAKLGLSKTPIYERIKKLEKFGFIKQYVALVDNKKIDKGLIIYISVSLNKHHKSVVDNFIKKVNSLHEVMECYYISGNADFLLKVYTKDMDGYKDFIENKFSVISDINQFFSSFVMDTTKYQTAFEFNE